MYVFVNPWIYDFAAYDYWAKPLGLLYIGSAFREAGYEIELIDCLEIDDRDDTDLKISPYGRKKFPSMEVSKPDPLKGTIPRKFKRYGCKRKNFEAQIRAISDPEAFFITSFMTYWYPGVREVIRIIKNRQPGVPVVLGGLYPRLCPEHSKEYSGADFTVTTPEEFSRCLSDLSIRVPVRDNIPFVDFYPVFDLYDRLDYVPLLASRGCPFECSYCASHLINSGFDFRSPEDVYREIKHWHRSKGVKDFVFYDDALFCSKEKLIIPLLKKVIRGGPDVRFHTPNGLHIRDIDGRLAGLLFEAGFKTLKLGLESSDPNFHKSFGEKTSNTEFKEAVSLLKDAGFDTELGVYVMAGLPGQKMESVERTLDFAAEYSVNIELAEYSPVPGTELWEKASNHSPFDLKSEPLFHNNILVPCRTELDYDDMNELKARIGE